MRYLKFILLFYAFNSIVINVTGQKNEYVKHLYTGWDAYTRGLIKLSDTTAVIFSDDDYFKVNSTSGEVYDNGVITGNYTHIRCVEKINDNILIGSSFATDPTVLMLDSNMNIIWSSILYDDVSSYGVNAMLPTNSSILAVGTGSEDNGTNFHTFISKLSFFGDTIWNVRQHYTGSTHLFFVDTLSDGKIIVSGSRNNHSMVQLIKDDGAVLWTFIDSSEIKFSISNQVVHSSDETKVYLIDNNLAIEIDVKNGQEISRKQLGFEVSDVITVGDSLVLCGAISVGSKQYPRIQIMNMNLDSLSSFTLYNDLYAGIGISNFYSHLVAQNDSSFLTIGIVNDSTAFPLFPLNTSIINGISFSAILSGNSDLISPEKLVSCFPNPSQKNFLITSENNIESVICYDQSGRMVNSIVLSVSRNSLEVQIENPGVYFLHVKTKNLEEVLQVVVVH